LHGHYSITALTKIYEILVSYDGPGTTGAYGISELWIATIEYTQDYYHVDVARCEDYFQGEYCTIDSGAIGGTIKKIYMIDCNDEYYEVTYEGLGTIYSGSDYKIIPQRGIDEIPPRSQI
jgi:hypothetical protein